MASDQTVPAETIEAFERALTAQPGACILGRDALVACLAASAPSLRAQGAEAERERIAQDGSANLANLTVPLIRRAISDPGSVLNRLGGYGVHADEPESLPNWQARAVLLTVNATVNRVIERSREAPSGT